jgi:hypothetical protein
LKPSFLPLLFPRSARLVSEEARQGGGRETTTLTERSMASTPAPATHPTDNAPAVPSASNADPGKGADGAVEGPAMEAIKLALQLADKATLPQSSQPRGKPQWNPDILTSALPSQIPSRCTTVLRRDDPARHAPLSKLSSLSSSSQSSSLLCVRRQISLCPCQPRSIRSRIAPNARRWRRATPSLAWIMTRICSANHPTSLE